MATMTRQHFELIAEVIKDHGDRNDHEARRHLAESFANRLTHTNPNFDRQRFIEAAGGKA